MPEAIIVGGGLAGTATALPCTGPASASTVYESRPASGADDVGAWLTLAGNGMDALTHARARRRRWPPRASPPLA